tara:strand:- start:227 stop:862 length:636 start_codon:yes stop_codon:yes gene_type:complete
MELMITKYLEIEGWFNLQDAYLNMVKKVPSYGTIVEIGCFKGRSTRFLCDALIAEAKPGVRVNVIDTFEGTTGEHDGLELGSMYDEFKNNLHDHLESSRVIPHVNRSDNQQLIDSFKDGSLDGLIIDGAHDEVSVHNDTKNWYPKLKDDGLLIWDDCERPEVKKGALTALGEEVSKGVYYITGDERWFGLIKGPNGKEMGKKLKLFPGMNL